MDNFDDKTPAAPAGANDLQEQFDGLRHLVVSILILLIVVSGTLSIYLLRQWRTVSKELTAYRPQAAQVVNAYQKAEAPAMQEFVKKITEFGRTHPDFAPIMTKYNLKPTTATNALPTTAPAPVSAPKAAPAKK
jgi:hypothetical protein